MSNPRFEIDGWCYRDNPAEGDDARKLVSIEFHGMVWVCIRAWNHAKQVWVNNGDPSTERITAWRDIPDPCRGFWQSGNLCGIKP